LLLCAKHLFVAASLYFFEVKRADERPGRWRRPLVVLIRS